MGSSEETCEGYARIAASLTKRTNTGNRLFFKQTFTQSLQAEGRQLRRNWWAPKLASGSRRERRVGDWQPKHDHGAGGGADVCQQHGWKLKWGRVEPPSLLSRSTQREKETRK